MDTRRLPYLVEFERHGSMRVVAELLGTSTSVVSQQIAALAREVGSPLVEPDGRRSRLTPAGRRLAEHARTITAAVEAAHLDLDPDAEPHGVVRVAGFATAVRRAVMPTVAALRASGSAVALIVREHEPAEAHGLLAADEVDLALTYDYDLAPTTPDRDLAVTPLWSASWGLAVPTSAALSPVPDAPGVVGAFADHEWIGNSRNPADERVLRLLASMAGFRPRMVHEADSLDLVEDLILAGLGVGLLPRDRPAREGVTVLPLGAPEVRLRAWAVTRRGRGSWPALALVLDRIAAAGAVDTGRAVS